MAEIRLRIIGIERVSRKLKEYRQDYTATSAEQTRLMRMIGAGTRDYARARITSQGDGEWAPLSKWTRAKTGRRKALITERARIKYRLKDGGVELYHDSPSPSWSLKDHKRGFTRPAVRGKVVIPLKVPSILGVNKPYIVLPKGSPATYTPPRAVYESDDKIMRKVVRPKIRLWLAEIRSKR